MTRVYTEMGWETLKKKESDLDTLEGIHCCNCKEAPARAILDAGKRPSGGRLLWAVCSNCADEFSSQMESNKH